MFTHKIYVIFFYIISLVVMTQNQPNFEVIQIERCGSNNKRPIQLHYINITNRGGKQYANFDATIGIPIGDNIDINCKIQYAAAGKLFVPLISVQEKDACKTANKYLNGFWHDIQRAARMKAGVCPMAPGNYLGKNVLLDFTKIYAPTAPFGIIKIILDLIDSKNPNTKYFCILLEVQSRRK